MRILTATALFVIAGLPAYAQTPARIRGTIVKYDGPALTVHLRSGPDLLVALAPGFVVTSVGIAKLNEVHPGSFIGTAAATQPDGSMRALEVHIFPESMRGTGEGHRPWDAGPETTMTNGTVGQVAGTDGRSLTVKYKDGEKTVTVPTDVPVVAFEIGTPSELSPGAHVVINATKAADGALSTNRVTVGKNGIEIPL